MLYQLDYPCLWGGGGGGSGGGGKEVDMYLIFGTHPRGGRLLCLGTTVVMAF